MGRYLDEHDLHRFAKESRSIRIAGHATSIRLEAVFWEILERLAAAEGVSIAKLVTTLQEEAVEALDGAVNLASVLRTVCVLRQRERPPAPPESPGAS
ncbi:ribbon-helix-helix domain-containing protein [Oharaeibacter diazotrophicus]|uniref:Putative DNA-binding ribbon-helix-helix protein n=1 Tax=Oharaeibacter diazotrophicus TaxID=1920512 RepID=A0A4R6RH40_9HYPH|nr:ribbon-helix-helix domain-containing protein [Oharaeibacter diazotrophicus]TDP84966.1 putative DNA-binding ribbon-helix-helix protein [Oharaeibacter diazotrophicus]BBE73935.1 hypothetical protein OHA_1_03560 [Pleomorphomonas sp. SM30]GLS76379.1 aryl-sulfate sulfotransferase [Oharaeibacter diazotrophicus]